MPDRKINTEGGAFVEKDVNTNRDFSGRDITHSKTTTISGHSIVALAAIFVIGIIAFAVIVKPDTRAQPPNWISATEQPKSINIDTGSPPHETNESLNIASSVTVTEQFHGNVAYSGDVRGINFSPTEFLFATAGGNNYTAIIWDANTGKQVRLFVGNSAVSSVPWYQAF